MFGWVALVTGLIIFGLSAISMVTLGDRPWGLILTALATTGIGIVFIRNNRGV
jgi:hypothetical protein